MSRSRGGGGRSGGFSGGGRTSIGSSSRGGSSRGASRPVSMPRPTPRTAPRPVSRPASRPAPRGNAFTQGVKMGAGMEVGRRMAGGASHRGMSMPRGGMGGGFNRAPMMGPRHVPMGRHRARRNSSGSSLGALLAIIVVVVLVIALGSAVNSFGHYGQIPASTIQRDALPSGVANTNVPGILFDGLNILGNQGEVMRGINSFHNATGIWPMLYTTDSIAGQVNNAQFFRNNFHLVESYMEGIFEGVTGNNSGNMLILMFEQGYDWDVWFFMGHQARAVMDVEAQAMLSGYIERYWDGQLTWSTERVFREALSDTGSRMMQITRPWWHMPLILIIVGTTIGVGGVIGLKVYRRRKDAEAREMENTERILATDLKGLDDDATRLAGEYEDLEGDENYELDFDED